MTISVYIDASDIDDNDLIDACIHRIQRSERFKKKFIEELHNNGVENLLIKKPDWLEKIDNYILENCQNLKGIMETEEKLGIA
jgi:hypothetical protein